MSLKADIAWVQQEIQKVNDPEFLNVIKYLLKEKLESEKVTPTDYIEELGCTIAEYNDELEQAKNDVQQGNFISHEVVEEEITKWLKEG